MVGVVTAVACADQSTPASPPSTVNPDGGAVPPPDDAGTSRTPGMIRVATFNVRRYFDTVCDSGNCTAGDFESVVNQATFDADTARIAEGIALIDPDVIALEEVENQHCLDALVAKLASMGKTFPIAHLGETGSAGSVDVAVLARGTLPEFKTHRETQIVEADGTKTTFTREFLEARMTFGATKVVMFAAHFRSKVADDPARRLAEATAAKAIVSKTATDLPTALVLLGGDLNDKPGSAPIAVLEDGGALLRVAKDIPVAAQGTYTFNGVTDAIDHIFAGAPQATRYVAKSATVYRTGAGGFSGSDHAALAADFTVQ